MFIFKNKRTHLIRKLWRVKGECVASVEARSSLSALLKRLKEPVLENLLRVLERRGQDCGTCCLIPRGEIRVGKQSVSPLLLICQVWRWEDVEDEGELVRLGLCDSSHSDLQVYECCNPYHWARQATKESCLCSSPPRPLLQYSPCDISECDSSVGSVATGGTHCYSAHSGGSATWGTLAYWEEQTRVGRLFPVSSTTVEVFQDLPRTLQHSQALSLRSLTKDRTPSSPISDSVLRTREKIGLGVILSLDGSKLRLYNRSDIPIFINSPTLEDYSPPATTTSSSSSSRTFSVYKLLPGYSMVVFDHEASEEQQQQPDPRTLDGPYDRHALRLSFGKGWGGKYSRQVITSCPCWLEILLNPPPPTLTT